MALPSGAVTLLFTDIEGSTLLLRRLGDAYAEVLSAQRRLLRAAFEEADGHELGTEGDSFFVAFADAADATRACVAAQRALAAHSWPEAVDVRVRMGLHTGEPTRHEDGYMGMDVHRAARIASSAHGGQIVLSEATAGAVQGQLDGDVSLLDLGWHRLKDLPTPERVYQLVGQGLWKEFPPLKSLGAPSNLPFAGTALIGRSAEQAEVRALLAGPDARLVTLTGPGGTGKTRLSIAVAASLDAQFVQGVFFVPLATVTDANLAWSALAEALGLNPADRTAADAVVDHLLDRHALLVLDNLEQLDKARDVITRILARAPKVSMLATSRRPLHVRGEHEMPLAPLPLPDSEAVDAAAAEASDAVRLFVQRARMVRPSFQLTDETAPDVAAICRRLDGLPLAIELAAARMKLLNPAALLARLDSVLEWQDSRGDRPARQQTLRGTIQWSYDLLDPALQAVFRAASVFSGGCDLDAFGAVALPAGEVPASTDPFDAATALVDLSLMTLADDADGEPRLSMLVTIREFARELLAAHGETDDVAARHARHYLDFATRATDEIHGPQQLVWLDRLETEHDNLRAALTWSLETAAAGATGTDVGLQLADRLGWFWYEHGHALEARRWLETAVAAAAQEPGPDLARVSHALGVVLLQLGDAIGGDDALARSLALWRKAGDATMVAQELNSLSVARRSLGDLDGARAMLEESVALARELHDDRRLASALSNLGVVLIDVGEPATAVQLFDECLRLDRARGDMWGAAVSMANMSGAHLRAGDYVTAHSMLCETLDEVVHLGDLELLADTLERFASAVAASGAHARAAQLEGAARRVRDEAGMPIAEPDLVLLERALGPARADLGRDEWDAAVAHGRALSTTDVVALAKASLPPRSASA